MMRSKLMIITLAAVLVCGCMFAVTNQAKTPGSTTGSSLSYTPVPEPSMSAEHPFAFPLKEETVKQIAVIAAIGLLIFMILKGRQFSK